MRSENLTSYSFGWEEYLELDVEDRDELLQRLNDFRDQEQAAVSKLKV